MPFIEKNIFFSRLHKTILIRYNSIRRINGGGGGGGGKSSKDMGHTETRRVAPPPFAGGGGYGEGIY